MAGAAGVHPLTLAYRSAMYADTTARAAGVGRVVYLSSVVAYGAHADNPTPIGEDHPLRGNAGFPYAEHKVAVEEALDKRTSMGLAGDLGKFTQYSAAEAMTVIWTTNVHPRMKVTWGTYPNHIGHAWFDGCFRCHSDEHESEDGAVISQDCETCHSLLAYEEEDPEILTQLSP